MNCQEDGSPVLGWQLQGAIRDSGSFPLFCLPLLACRLCGHGYGVTASISGIKSAFAEGRLEREKCQKLMAAPFTPFYSESSSFSSRPIHWTSALYLSHRSRNTLPSEERC